MQIRLTVLGPRSGHQTATCDVLVTAPAGTPLAAVASGLAATVGGPDTGGTVILYAGRDRLDPQRRILGEPPLVDGAVLSLHVPACEDDPADDAAARLHVVAGPDAGGVHLLHGGRISVGRSADADVPLDDPDVSRVHCAVTVAEDGRVAVADLDSTNGTALDGRPLGRAPVPLPPGALLRVGESTLRLAPPTAVAALATTPDAEGHLRVHVPGDPEEASATPGGSGTGAGSTGRGSDDASARADGPAGGRDAGGAAAGGTAAGGAAAQYGRRAADGRPASPVPAGDHTHGHRVPGASDTGPAGAPGHAAAAAAPAPYARQHPVAEDPEVGEPPVRQRYGTVSSATHLVDPYADRGTTGHGPADPDRQATQGRGRTYAGPYPAAPGNAAAPQHYGRVPHQPSAGDRSAPGARASAPQQPRHAPQHPAPGPGHPSAGPQTYGPGTAAGPQHPGSAPGFPAAGPQVPGGGAPGLPDGGPVPGTSAAGAAEAEAAEAPRRRRGFGAWARRWAGRDGQETVAAGPEQAPAAPDARNDDHRPDAAELLLTALGPGPRLWERGRRHPEALEVRLGFGVAAPLRACGGLGLAGPRARLAGLARSVLAQLAALHAPRDLEIVLISTDRARPLPDRRAEWAWLGWLPHVRPGHGQDCRLLLAYDKDQAAARTAELTRRLDDGALGPQWASQAREAVAAAAAAYTGPYTVLVLDGDPGPGPLRDTVARLAGHGPAAGIHVLCLAEAPSASPASPLDETYETACAASPAFRECGTAALLSGDVATAVRVLPVRGGRPAGHGRLVTADAVSAAWAERFARALAPLRADCAGPEPQRPAAAALPATARLLDELGLARATPASLMARWAAATEQGQEVGGLAELVLGGGRRGPVGAELVAEGPHLLIEGPAGSGRTELLRSVAASLAAGARPDRLGLVLLDGAGGERGGGLQPCTELPHVSAHLVAADPVRMREFAQALGAELKRRAELLDGVPFADWHAARALPEGREAAARVVAPRRPGPAESTGDLDPARTGTLRLRAAAVRTEVGPTPLPRLVVLVDDYDALVAPALGSTGRPAAGSVVRALEAVARDGARLGVHLVATTSRPDRTADTELGRAAGLRVELEAVPASGGGADRPAPGRGVLRHPDGRTTPFQGGRVTGRIPRTATQRPTVVPVEWERMGDPPARRPVRELGNGPTDLALLASALDRASHLVSAVPVLFPAAP